MKTVPVIHFPRRAHQFDDVAIEAPLAIDIMYGKAFHRKYARFTTTMRSLGHDRELAFGLLFSEGIIDDVEHVIAIEPCLRGRLAGTSSERITVHLDFDRAFQPLDHATAHPRYAGCGICGSKDLPPKHPKTVARSAGVDVSTLLRMPDQITHAQKVFAHTGGVHAAALFDEQGRLRVLFEDIGRHNALDKLIGHGLLQNIDVSRGTLVLSSRASFEIVQKAARARVAIVAVMGAVSSLAVELAEQHGITLIGFLRSQRCNVYTHYYRVKT